jgi:hypothetical protein
LSLRSVLLAIANCTNLEFWSHFLPARNDGCQRHLSSIQHHTFTLPQGVDISWLSVQSTPWLRIRNEVEVPDGFAALLIDRDLARVWFGIDGCQLDSKHKTGDDDGRQAHSSHLTSSNGPCQDTVSRSCLFDQLPTHTKERQAVSNSNISLHLISFMITISIKQNASGMYHSRVRSARYHSTECALVYFGPSASTNTVCHSSEWPFWGCTGRLELFRACVNSPSFREGIHPNAHESC